MPKIEVDQDALRALVQHVHQIEQELRALLSAGSVEHCRKVREQPVMPPWVNMVDPMAPKDREQLAEKVAVQL